VAKRSRAKGLSGEHEVAQLYRKHGFTVRGLEGLGDHLVLGHSLSIFSEVKRAERCQIWEWLGQTWREAPAGSFPILAFRRNRSPWIAAAPLDGLLYLIDNYEP